MATPSPPSLSIPTQYRQHFTDAQAEELVAQFRLSDADGSGAIDEREFHALLTTLSLRVTPQEASQLVASIDVDGNGLVDFAELVEMVVKIKHGDSQFQKLRTFLDALETTPVALLEREAAKFQMRVSYQLLEERPGTKSTPPVYVMALTLQGKWLQEGHGELTLQATGKTTREAKFGAAEQGLVRMRQLKPGLACEPGDVPPAWQDWLFENLDKGSPPAKVLQKMHDKGFSPAQNARLMQRISTRASSLRLRKTKGTRRRSSKPNEKATRALPIYDEVPRHADDRTTTTSQTTTERCNGLHPLWVHWAQQELARGIDGRVVLEELVFMGFEPLKFPFVTQSFERASYLRQDDGTNGNNKNTNNLLPLPLTPRGSKRRVSHERLGQSKLPASALPEVAQATLPPRPYSFWSCLQDGNRREIELFVYGGQELNVVQLDATSKLELTPMQVASKHGHADLVGFLLDQGAQLDQQDAFHRTPLLLAAREGHTEVCRLLLARGTDLLATDALSNTALHCAAVSGSAGLVDVVLEAFNERLLVFLARLPREKGTSYPQLLRTAHEQVMHAKLRENERRRFHKSWCWDALLWVHNELFQGREGGQRIVPAPTAALMDHVLEGYHAGFLQQRRLELLSASEGSPDDEEQYHEQEDEQQWDVGVRQRKAAERAARYEWIECDQVVFCVDLCLRESFKNARNSQGRTALHVACDENLVCTHELVVQRLAETHGCDPELRDNAGHTPLELLLASKGRPGSPRGDQEHERAILTARRVRINAEDAERERQRLATKRSKWQTELQRLSRDFLEIDTLERAKKSVRSRSASPSMQLLVGWEVHEEPLSRNRLFVNAASGFVQRQVPAKLVAFTAQRLAWKEKLALHAHFVEQHRDTPEWELHRVNASDVYFFFNRESTDCRWLPPPEAPARSWKTKRIFQEQTQLDDCADHAALALEFSGSFSEPLRSDCVRGRRLGTGWRECLLFGVVFHWNETDDRVAVEKPSQVLEGEAIRYAQALMRARSEEIEELGGGWRRWYDGRSAQSFYFDDSSGDCVLDVDADRAFLKHIQKPRSRRIHDAQLTTEERGKRLEEHEWKQTLERARQRETHGVEKQEQAQAQADRQRAAEHEHADALRALEASVTTEHYDESCGRPLGYVDARFQRERAVFLAAKKLDSLTSLNPSTPRPRDEIERALELSLELERQERDHAAIEDCRDDHHQQKLSLCERRRVARILWKIQERIRLDLVLCRWGCAMWFSRLQSLLIHEKLECPRRRLVCRLGCGLVREDRVWQREIGAHESAERALCDSRIVACPRDCGVFSPHLVLQHHMAELCVRRPVGDLKCRLGCGAVYTGGAHELLAIEQQRVTHEQDACELRKVQCTWPQCRALLIARDRNDHRRTHLISSGVCSFLTAELHEYKVPKGTTQLKIQAWGAGGGSGRLKSQSVGHGGGGAFVEGVCTVFPGETLFFAVGAGGSGGKCATMAPNEAGAVKTHVSAAPGGLPGGGVGHAGNKKSACGGGGGYTSVYRNSAFGIEYILIAAGGGGGGTCRHGGGGSGLQAAPFRPFDDPHGGRPGAAQQGGKAGECDAYNPICRFVGTDGVSLQGGDGAEYGGGGGGGLFGGGGGGFAPGIAGGGGGGSSFVNISAFAPKTVVVLAGAAVQPGGLDRQPPRSVHRAYWDVVDGGVGEGGTGDSARAARGNHGGVRIAKPGFFKDMHHHR